MKSLKLKVSTPIPESGFLRLFQIIGRPAVTEDEAEQNRRDAEAAIACGQKPNKKPKRPRPAVQSIIPVSRASWYKGIKSGIYPTPIKLGARISVWKASDIQALVDQIGGSL